MWIPSTSIGQQVVLQVVRYKTMVAKWHPFKAFDIKRTQGMEHRLRPFGQKRNHKSAWIHTPIQYGQVPLPIRTIDLGRPGPSAHTYFVDPFVAGNSSVTRG